MGIGKKMSDRKVEVARRLGRAERDMVIILEDARHRIWETRHLEKELSGIATSCLKARQELRDIRTFLRIPQDRYLPKYLKP